MGKAKAAIKARWQGFKFRWTTERSTDDFVSTKECWSFALTDLGQNSSRLLMAGYLTIYLTSVLGLDVVAVGLLSTISTIIGYLRDPILAILLDNTKSRWGRFRPWLIVAAPLTAVIAMLFFLNPFYGDDPNNIPYVYTLYILYGTAAAITNTAWGGLQMCVTHNDNQKKKFFSIAKMLTILSTITVSSLPIYMDICPKIGISTRALFIYMAIKTGILAIAGCVFAVNLRERVVLPPKSNALKNIGMVFKNKNIMLTWLDNIPSLIDYQANLAGTYVLIYCYGLYSIQTVIWTISGFVAWVPMLLYKRMMKRMSTKLIILIYYASMTVASLLLYFVGYGTSFVYIAILIGIKSASAAFEYVANVSKKVFTTDIWDHYEWKHKVRNEAVTGQIGSYVSMPFNALKGVLFGALFTAIGFKSGEDVQSQSTMDGLFLIWTLGYAIVYILKSIPYLLIKLDKKTMLRVHRDLDARRRQKESKLDADARKQYAAAFFRRQPKHSDDIL